MRLSRRQLQIELYAQVEKNKSLQKQVDQLRDTLGSQLRSLEYKIEAITGRVEPVILDGKLYSVRPRECVRGVQVDLATVINAWLDASGEKLVYHESKIVVE